ncbi:MAG: hypothetical protein HC853_04850 [Anaerolineae bacterium]|nr:hypothetical protein [Anaerolineae bacterium]
MLANSTYKGRTYYGKWKRYEKGLALNSKDEWIEIPNQAIVDKQTFELAQDIFKENKETVRGFSIRPYLLSRMVVCTECGKAYITQTHKAGRNRRTMMPHPIAIG